jgi:methyltransferase OMS1
MAPKISPKVLAIGGAIYIATSSATYFYLKNGKPSPCSCPSHSASALSKNRSGNSIDTFDRIARDYDDNINVDELLMGVKLLRRFLIGEARGDVLEVSAGTGRNLRYYTSPDIRSVTLTDASREMLLRAHEKYSAAVAEAEKSEKKENTLPRTSFLLADVANLCVEGSGGSNNALNNDQSIANRREEGAAGEETAENLNSNDLVVEPTTRFGPALKTVHQLSPSTYDTVVDTFGLCSCENPVQALQEMSKALKPGGQLLLLEHGRSTWNFINSILDSSAEKHLEKWGCRWNRDIEGLVKEAGLEVASMQRWHFGTTFVIKCRKVER